MISCCIQFSCWLFQLEQFEADTRSQGEAIHRMLFRCITNPPVESCRWQFHPSGGCNGKTRKQLLDDWQRCSSTIESMKPSAVYNLESYWSMFFFYTSLPPAQALQVISIFRSGARRLQFPIDCATIPPLESSVILDIFQWAKYIAAKLCPIYKQLSTITRAVFTQFFTLGDPNDT